MNPLASLRRLWANTDQAAELLKDIRDATARMAAMVEFRPENAYGPVLARPADIEVLPVQDIPYALLELGDGDTIPRLEHSADFQKCTDFFARSPSASRSLISPDSQALLYSLVRSLRPRMVVEIGTFRAATTEALARAVQANSCGLVHTIDPFGAMRVPEILAAWPLSLREWVRFHAVTSMTFFANLALHQPELGLVFIDGNHDYEFAMFDVLSAARFIEPGGIIAIDNVAQPGPYLALRDFLAANPGWRELGGSIASRPFARAFDRDRTGIRNTEMALIQSPPNLVLGARPYSSGQILLKGTKVQGVELHLAAPAMGRIKIQVVLRSFHPRLEEFIFEARGDLGGEVGRKTIFLDQSAEVKGHLRNTVEIWCIWDGEDPLKLAGRPVAV